uniref:Carbonic anhydrase n=1 Tax=Oryzias latipes TaxID=8090 RepID=A0A3P9JBV2_ORYLA
MLKCLLQLDLVLYTNWGDWCYNTCLSKEVSYHSPSHWKDMEGSSCGDSRQSPIDIQTSSVKSDPNLDSFIFQGFDSTQVIKSITNNGHTDKLVNVSGGGLNGMYNVLQFHFHWGKADFINHPGSEHTVDGNRYPMEMHIVSMKDGLSSEQEDGYAVLGFFINVRSFRSWRTATIYVFHISNFVDQMVNVDQNISINGLIGNVDLSKYYRYMGSLTTPQCSEAVVWTLFHEPIPVNSTLVSFSIQMFPLMTSFVDIYRPTQDLNGRQVYTSASSVPSELETYVSRP